MRIRVHGLGPPVRLDGAFYPPDHFPCTWQIGAQRGEFDLPADATRALGDIIRPLDGVSGLEVGQSWRINLLNPLAGMIPDWGARFMANQSMVVRVVRKEKIEHRGESVEAFVIQADKMQAWMTPEGRLIRQEYELPLIGRLVLVDEPVDKHKREIVLREALQKAGG